MMLCTLWAMLLVGQMQNLLTIGATHATEQSGLLDKLLPAFTKATGVAVRAAIIDTWQV